MPTRYLNLKEVFVANRERINAKEAFHRELAQDDKLVRRAQWEANTGKAIDRRITAERVQAAHDAYEAKVLARRRRLADLYNSEVEEWRNELLSRAETSEDRKNKIREKATALKARNEAARQEFVKSCYDRRWWLANDEARLLDSQALEQYVIDARLAQIQEKQARKEKLTREEEVYFEQIQTHVRKMEALEAERQAKKEKQRRETIEVLEEQIQTSEERRERHAISVAEQDARELAELDEALRQEQEKIEARRQAEHQRGQEVRACNEARLGIRQQKKAEELAQDMALLDFAVAKERAEEAAEHAKYEKAMSESLAYQNYLQKMMIQEAQDETALNQVRKDQENKVWEKRDAVQRAQREARARLAEQVHKGRQEQLRLKAIADQEDAKLQAVQVAKWRKDIAEGLEKDREELEARRKIILENSEMLKKQLEEKKRRARLEAQQEYLTLKHEEREEAERQRRQKEQAGVVRLHYPLTSMKWTT